MISLYSRNLGVQRLALLLWIFGSVLGCITSLNAFHALERQRYWSKHVRSLAAANPGSSLEWNVQGGGLQLLGPHDSASPNAPPHGFRLIIESFGYTSPDPPSVTEYLWLLFRVAVFGGLPWLLTHAFAWVVVGFRSSG